MAAGQFSKFIDRLRGVLVKQEAAGLGDGELLKLYLRQREETAFEALLRRHGPMVMGVCERVLRNSHDAEDAFQATFLVFVRKASTLRSPGRVANWLYGVAYRTALEARKGAAKRRMKEAEVVRPRQTPPDVWADLRPVLDRELQRLPTKYRTVLVLCDLEGKTRKEAAQQLGCPEGTVASRLASARVMLAKRLARSIPTVSGGALAAVLSRNATACLSTPVIASTVQAATWLATGKTATGLVSAKIIALTESVLKTMLQTKIKIATVLFLAVAVACYGVGLLSVRFALGQNSTSPRAAAPSGEKKSADNPGAVRKSKVLQLDGSNAHIAWSSDGKELASLSFTIVMEEKTINGEKRNVYGTNSTLKFWDVAKGEVRLSLGEEKKVRMTSMAFSPDGKTLGVGVENQAAEPGKVHEVRLLDTQTGAIKKTIPNPWTVRAVIFSPDDKLLAIGGHYRPEQLAGPFQRMIRLWDLGKEKLITEFKQKLELNQQQIEKERYLDALPALAFSPDGKLLATADVDHTVRLLDVQIGQLTKALERQDCAIPTLRFSPNGAMLISGNANGTGKVWDVKSGKLLRTLAANKDEPVWSVDFSPDGNLLVTSGPQTEPQKRDGQVVLWDTRSWEAKRIPRRVLSDGWVNAVAFSPDGKTLAISSTHITGLCETIGQIELWRVSDLLAEGE
jgi:RNA polymerase sigma factor (sigma-70 family)